MRIPVDLTNPGQFFACCGMLELADRLWSKSSPTGVFASDSFELAVGGIENPFKEIGRQLNTATITQTDNKDDVASPLVLGCPFELRLDWWVKVAVDKTKKQFVDLGGGEQLKTWSGRQKGPIIFQRMKEACAALNWGDPFNDAVLVFDQKDGENKIKSISPFYFDSRREGTSVDVGFSLDEQGMSVFAFPVIETFALIGLQRFRPRVVESQNDRRFVYFPWREPLPASVASVAASGFLSSNNVGEFTFRKPSRGGEYATMFSRGERQR